MKTAKNTRLSLPVLILFCLSGPWRPTLAADTPQSAECPDSSMSHSSMSAGHQPHAADTAIAQKADEQCANCHGSDGISINDNIPNLAGQVSSYMCGWLAGCRRQGDKCEGHEDLAGKFSDRDIVDFAEYYSHLPSDKW